MEKHHHMDGLLHEDVRRDAKKVNQTQKLKKKPATTKKQTKDGRFCFLISYAICLGIRHCHCPILEEEEGLQEVAEELFSELVELSLQEPERAMEYHRQGDEIRLGSDCCGLGSDFLALKLLGCDIKPLFCSEICPDKIKMMTIMHAKFGHSPLIMGDIKDRQYDTMPTVDLFVSGAPCPAFSSVGRKKALSDKRGVVILHSLKYIVLKRPPVALLENVTGLSHKPNRPILDKIILVLKNAGYRVSAEIIDTSDHGIPHSRHRIYIASWTASAADACCVLLYVANRTAYRNSNLTHLSLR